MNWRHIIGILRQEFHITYRSVEVIIDIFFFPLISIVVFGFLSLYLSGGNNTLAGQYVLLGMILWQIIWIIQYSVSVGALWNIWAHNLSNMFVAPLTVREYVLTLGVGGIVKAFLLVGSSAVMSYYVFDFNLLDVGLGVLALASVNFALFAFSAGLSILGLIFRYGTRIQAFAWGLITIFQPLSAAFYPLEVLPPVLQYVAYLFPPTFTFEAVRFGLTEHAIHWQFMNIAFAENALYLVASLVFFRYMFRMSRETGQFARNES